MVWLLFVFFVALAVAIFRGGRLGNLADIHIRSWWLLPFGFILQAVAGFIPQDRATIGVGLILVSYLPLVALIALNRTRPGMWLMGLGILMNFAVISFNGGMPVLREAAVVAADFDQNPVVAEGYKHVILGPDTLLPFLADVIPIRLFGQGQVISLGDVFLAIGLASFLQAELRRPVRWFKRGVTLQGGSATRPR
jgi:Family of unknown function (DUF5317)